MTKINEQSIYVEYNKIALKNEVTTNPQNYKNAQALFPSYEKFADEFVKFEQNAHPNRVSAVKSGFGSVLADMSKDLFGKNDIKAATEYIELLSKIILQHR